MYKLGTFIELSVLLAYVSRASLRAPRSHGFFRFFAAEFLLGLILLNVDHWFVDPLSGRQVVSWVLLVASAALVLCGALTLKVVGEPDSGRTSEIPIAGIEKTTVLVSKGIYRYIRHPIYVGIYLFSVGLGCIFFAWLWFGVLLIFIPLWYIECKGEENQLISTYGEAYIHYQQRTGMFFPKIT